MAGPVTAGAMLAAEFGHETANTRRFLERVPWEKADWRPHPKSMPLGNLAVHLASLHAWAQAVVADDGLDLASFAARGFSPPAIHSRDALLAYFDETVAAAGRAIGGASDEVLGQIWTLRQGERVIMSLPKAAVLRSMVLSHSIHHRAQLGVYLRLNDIPVPGVYGPSADEA